MLKILGEMMKDHIVQSRNKEINLSRGSIKERTLHR